MKGKWTVSLILVLILGLLLPADAGADFNLPDNFDDDRVVGGISQPTSFDWLPEPNGLLITSQGGNLYRWDGVSQNVDDPVLDLTNTVCLGSETGLLGLAVDPDFESGERFVYLYYTDIQGDGDCEQPNRRANRVSRFTVESDGDIPRNSEEVLIDNISAKGGNHNGGDLQFGKDELLYVSVGDAGQDLITGEGQDNNRNARKLSLLNGKILRIETNGSIPDGNPFTGNGTRQCGSTGSAASAGKRVESEKKNRKHKNKKKKRRIKRKRRQQNNAGACQEIFATGLRNPFRIAFDPDDNSGPQRFYINDVGGNAWEEIDEGRVGADYGWNVREGPCRTGQSNCSPSGGGFELPVFAYRANTGCRTITGGAFVPESANWPAAYDDVYLYADLACNILFALRNEEFGETPEEFGTDAGAVHLRFGPDNNLYYADFNTGEIHQITPP